MPIYADTTVSAVEGPAWEADHRGLANLPGHQQTSAICARGAGDRTGAGRPGREDSISIRTPHIINGSANARGATHGTKEARS